MKKHNFINNHKKLLGIVNEIYQVEEFTPHQEEAIFCKYIITYLLLEVSNHTISEVQRSFNQSYRTTTRNRKEALNLLSYHPKFIEMYNRIKDQYKIFLIAKLSVL